MTINVDKNAGVGLVVMGIFAIAVMVGMATENKNSKELDEHKKTCESLESVDKEIAKVEEANNDLELDDKIALKKLMRIKRRQINSAKTIEEFDQRMDEFTRLAAKLSSSTDKNDRLAEVRVETADIEREEKRRELAASDKKELDMFKTKYTTIADTIKTVARYIFYYGGNSNYIRIVK